MHATSYLLKLQIDYVILDGDGQACPGMPKEAFETYIYLKNGWSSNVDFLDTCHLPLGESDHFTLCIDF